MNRPVLAAALVLFAIGAATLIVRCGSSSTPSDLVSGTGVASATSGSSALDLAEPTNASVTTARGDAAAVVERAPPTAPAGPLVTGVRVHITAIEDGRPLAGVRVRAVSGDPRSAWKPVDSARGTELDIVRTGADGIVEIELAPGTLYTLDVDATDGSAARGSAKVDPPLAPGHVRTIPLALRTELDVTMHGRVIDRETRQPIVGARVGREAGWGAIATGTEQLTDGDGRFRVEGSAWRRTMLFVIADRYELAGFRLVDAHDGPDRAFEVELSIAGSVRATVIDARGTPIPGVQVVLTASRNAFARPVGIAAKRTGWGGTTIWVAHTDARGVAELGGLPTRNPIEATLLQGSEELLRAKERITLGTGESRSVEWRVAEKCTIHGIAREQDGSPAAGLSIQLARASAPRTVYLSDFESTGSRESAVCDPEGRFVFAEVAAGDWWIGPSRQRRISTTVTPDDPAPLAQLVVVPPDVPRVDVELSVHRGLSIAGRVLDPRGEPIQNAVIRFRGSDGTSGSEVIRTHDGHFRIGPLHPGEFDLTAEAHGRFIASEPVRARPRDRDVVLRMRNGGSLRGFVVDGVSGKPSTAEVVVRARDSSSGRRSMPSLDPQGQFELGGLEPGLYDVWASAPGGRVGSARGVEVLVGARSDARIELVPGARVQVRYQGPGRDAEVYAVSDGAIVGVESLRKDREAWLAVSAGKIVLRLRERGADVDHDLPLELAVGAQRELVFDGAWR